MKLSDLTPVVSRMELVTLGRAHPRWPQFPQGSCYEMIGTVRGMGGRMFLGIPRNWTVVMMPMVLKHSRRHPSLCFCASLPPYSSALVSETLLGLSLPPSLLISQYSCFCNYLALSLSLSCSLSLHGGHLSKHRQPRVKCIVCESAPDLEESHYLSCLWHLPSF